MSEDQGTGRYLYSTLEEQTASPRFSYGDDAPGRSPAPPRHRMSGFADAGRRDAELALHSDGSDSSRDQRASPRRDPHALHEDVEMKSSGSSANDSHGHESPGSSHGHGKDSALLESSESHKSSNSQSPSPPSSSNAFSLLSASSEPDNPSTSGCSSEQSAKAKTQKELIKTLKELKVHLPPENRSKGKSSTLSTLKYALRCVKQVKANEEYYQLLMINDSQPSGLDVSSYTIEEIDSITSEYTLKNTDIFAVAVSLITGKIVYISDQAASILNCKRDVFRNTKFVEFLTPQDVSVFYSFTTPYRLPSWSMCTGAESSPSDCVQEKSFFCRISGGRERDGDIHYYPFRMTPYLMKVQDTEHTEDQFCCLLLAERVHSGYEAPRIPTDKRIFTTTHTPSCVFQDVDERAVPLLGYLPQDLIGTPVLLHLHPNDRPLMLAIHRKILQYAGQPFDHSSIRFCARNGEYVTLDTSWSSFVNPWSRKVSFVIGRHKVRTGPVNEDVFAAPAFTEGKIVDSDIQEITEQIHRLLLQPVHNNGSSGYGSLGSNGSHEHIMSVASSSESNGNANEDSCKLKPRTFQEICKGVQMLKNQGQQVFITSTAKPEGKRASGESAKSVNTRAKDSPVITGKENVNLDDKTSAHEELSYKDQTVYSYQQMSCLDSVIRYLESCNIPITVKRKCESSSNTTSSNSDDDKQKVADDNMQVSEAAPPVLEAQAGLPSLKAPKKTATAAVVGASLTPLALPSKAESVVSITSQCSYSSTIVHVGDKKPQPESEIIEDGPNGADAAESQPPAPAASTVSPLSQEKETYKKLGLTKQVLAAHTQKEEQAFLSRFRELRGAATVESTCGFHLQEKNKRSEGVPGPRVARQGGRGAEAAAKKSGKNKKTKSKRIKQQESSDSTASHRKQPHRPPLVGLNHTSWSPSDTSQSTFPAMPFPTVMPAYPMQVFPAGGAVPPGADPAMSGFGDGQNTQDIRCPVQPPAYPTPLVTPMVAFVLPNYVFPQMSGSACQPLYPEQTSFPAHSAFPGPSQFAPQNPFPVQPPFPGQPFHYGVPPEAPKTPAAAEPREGPSRSSTPQSAGARDPASPPLFQSRCSSPLQLNLLQLEEAPRSVERADNAGDKGAASSTAQPDEEPQPLSLSLPGLVNSYGASANIPLTSRAFISKDTLSLLMLKSEENLVWNKVWYRGCCNTEVGSPGDGPNSDAHSTSSDLLDILLQEDSRSGTGSATSGCGGSATSGSLGSGSNGCSTSASGTGSSQTSNTSKYFGSIDSSENDHKTKKGEGGMELEESDHLIKYVLQEPIWLMMANADEKVMMTYQIPSRDLQTVLKEDREKLKQMQKRQPRFTEEQRKELLEVHPWMKKGGLPKAIDVTECVCCEDGASALFEVDMPDIELEAMVDPGEDNHLKALSKGSEEQIPAEESCSTKTDCYLAKEEKPSV
ncbi:period circadian protein homolog 2 isoform X1 [Lepisosteus oculatus]|uniref:period circadian protein homolog 2 isoform X1 n=1 Tax=Lepisosteus oculatus TaxID=7918 RepID=UPI0035F51C8D